MAKAWLGKIFEELGEESPYKSGKKTVEDIESTADVSHPYMGLGGRGIKFWIDKNHVEKIDWLRSEIDKIINEDSDELFQVIMETNLKTEIGSFNSFNQAIINLTEAKFQLGFELGRIRKEEK